MILGRKESQIACALPGAWLHSADVVRGTWYMRHTSLHAGSLPCSALSGKLAWAAAAEQPFPADICCHLATCLVDFESWLVETGIRQYLSKIYENEVDIFTQTLFSP